MTETTSIAPGAIVTCKVPAKGLADWCGRLLKGHGKRSTKAGRLRATMGIQRCEALDQALHRARFSAKPLLPSSTGRALVEGG